MTPPLLGGAADHHRLVARRPRSAAGPRPPTRTDEHLDAGPRPGVARAARRAGGRSARRCAAWAAAGGRAGHRARSANAPPSPPAEAARTPAPGSATAGPAASARPATARGDRGRAPPPTWATSTGPPAPGTGGEHAGPAGRPATGSGRAGRRSASRLSTGRPSRSATSSTRSPGSSSTSTRPSSAQRRTTIRSLEVRSASESRRAVHHRVDRDAVLLELPGERVDHHAEPQQARRAAAVEVDVADHLGQVDDRPGQRGVGAEPALDGVEHLADLESHPERSARSSSIRRARSTS